MKILYIVTATLLFCLGIEASSSTDIEEFLKKDAVYVKCFRKDRIYLKSEHLTFSEDKIYLSDQLDQKIPVSKLFCDSRGVYTLVESFKTDLSTVYPIVWCHTCGAWRTVNGSGRCVVCGNSP